MHNLPLTTFNSITEYEIAASAGAFFPDDCVAKFCNSNKTGLLAGRAPRLFQKISGLIPQSGSMPEVGLCKLLEFRKGANLYGNK